MESENKLQAPKGKYRVIGVDTFEALNADYIIGDYKDRIKAIRIAKNEGGTMNPTYVYDDEGNEVSGGFGSF